MNNPTTGRWLYYAGARRMTGWMRVALRPEELGVFGSIPDALNLDRNPDHNLLQIERITIMIKSGASSCPQANGLLPVVFLRINISYAVILGIRAGMLLPAG